MVDAGEENRSNLKLPKVRCLYVSEVDERGDARLYTHASTDFVSSCPCICTIPMRLLALPLPAMFQ
jgi:hypothetical protein